MYVSKKLLIGAEDNVQCWLIGHCNCRFDSRSVLVVFTNRYSRWYQKRCWGLQWFYSGLTGKFRNSRSSRTRLLSSKSFLFNNNYINRCHV